MKASPVALLLASACQLVFLAGPTVAHSVEPRRTNKYRHFPDMPKPRDTRPIHPDPLIPRPKPIDKRQRLPLPPWGAPKPVHPNPVPKLPTYEVIPYRPVSPLPPIEEYDAPNRGPDRRLKIGGQQSLTTKAPTQPDGLD